MALAGDPRTAPFAVSAVSGLIAVLALARAMRRDSISDAGASIALVVVVCWRWSLYSAASGGVPEMPAVALLCVAIERWGAGSAGSFWQTGLALSLAAGFRYEAWLAIAGLALAGRDRSRPRWELPTALALAAVVPCAWLVVNHLHRGDAFDFLHRVSTHRREVAGALPPWWSRWTEVPRSLLTELPWTAVAVAFVARARPVPAVVRISTAAAMVILAGLTLEAARGGGATHHPARTLLPVAWLLVPALAFTLESALRRWHWGWALAAAIACAAWCGPRRAEFATLGAPDAAAMGAEVARRWPRGRWCLEMQRQDALWVQWRSGRSRAVIPDRVFGARPAGVGDRAAACASAVGAVTSSSEFEEALGRGGFQLVMRRGAWALLTPAN